MTALSSLFSSANLLPLQFTVDGEMTNPSQPCFRAEVNTDQTDATGDGTEVSLTGDFWTESFDVGNNFSQGTFTAPVNGKYSLTAWVYLTGVASTHVQANLRIATSNKTVLYSLNLYGIAYNGTSCAVPLALIVDMDENDTAILSLVVSSGVKTIDVQDVFTVFSGALIC